MFKKNILITTAILSFCSTVAPLMAMELDTKAGGSAVSLVKAVDPRVAAAAAPMLAHNNNSSWPTVSRINRFLGDILTDSAKAPYFDHYVDVWHDFVNLLNDDNAVVCGKHYFTENDYSAVLIDLTKIDPTQLNYYSAIARRIIGVFPHQVDNTRLMSILPSLPVEHLDDYVNALTTLSGLDFSEKKNSRYGGAAAFLEVLKTHVKPDILDRVMTGVQADLTAFAITSYDRYQIEPLIKKLVNQLESEQMNGWFTRDVLTQMVWCRHSNPWGKSELDVRLESSFENYRSTLGQEVAVESSAASVDAKEKSFQLTEVSDVFWNQYNIKFTPEMQNQLVDAIYEKITPALTDVDHTAHQKMNVIARSIDEGRTLLLRQAKKVQYPS
jgi:hypothetical protein